MTDATNRKEILDQIMVMNINQCVFTTYDQSVAECARLAIVRQLAESWGIVYNTQPQSRQDFPVKTNLK